MSVDHVMSALILIVSMTILLVNGGPAKHHLSNTPNPGRPSSDDTSCRGVCKNVSTYCNRACYPSDESALFTTIFPGGGVTTSGSVDPRRFKCLSKCMDEEDPIVFEDENCSAEKETIQPQNEQEVTRLPGEEDDEVDVSSLTMSDRCHMEPWVNTTVCAFDRENPIVSQKVFDVNKPKLTLCPGSPVLKGRNGFSLKKSFSQEEKQSTATLSRKVRSVFNGIGSPSEPSSGNLPTGQDNKNEPTSWLDSDEFCASLPNYESPRSAIHEATNLRVDLYFYAGYSQWFQVAQCSSREPRQNMPGGIKSHCDVAYTAVKAWVVIDQKKFNKTAEVKNCGTVKDVEYLVCNDWILLPTHCKHYFRL